MPEDRAPAPQKESKPAPKEITFDDWAMI